MTDHIEYFEVKSGAKPGWRFRFLNGSPDPLLISSGSYPTPARAREVADKINRLMFGGHYRLGKA